MRPRGIGTPAAPATSGEIAVLVAITVGAAALRLRRLGLATLTGDEWFMHRNAQEGAQWIIEQARVFEPHPLLYYLGIWAWEQVAGWTEYALRFPSVLFGCLTIVAVWRLVREIGGTRAGLVAALFLAVNPYAILQSQNARNYAMVAALATLATAALVAAKRAGQRSGWMRYAVLMSGGLHTHLNAALTLASHLAHAAIVSLRQGTLHGRASIAAPLLVLALFVPWLAYASPALLAYQGYFPERLAADVILARTITTFATAGGVGWLPGVEVLLAILGVLGTIRAVQYARSAPDSVLLPLAAAVPVVAALALFAVRPMFEERYLIVAAPLYLGLAAYGVGIVPSRIALVASCAVAVLMASSVPDAISRTIEGRPDWRGIAGAIAERVEPGGLVLITGQGVADAYGYYRQTAHETAIATETAEVASAIDGALRARPRTIVHLPFWETAPDAMASTRLSAVGYPAETRWFRGQRMQMFLLPGSVGATRQAVGVRWPGVELIDVTLASDSSTRGRLAGVEIRWRSIAGSAPGDWKVSLRLVDPAGRRVAQIDRKPGSDSRPFPAMTEQPFADRYALLVPADAPATLNVDLLIYEPDTLRAVEPIGPEHAPILEGTVVRLTSINLTA
ncbi:MAG: hypothetical protein FJ033_03825 [Chloroflexi bacterium]|nr:hypothetical protein [Chloroflexota bacterium]